MEKPPTFFRIFSTFFRIGATAYGGVWASTRRIERAAVDENAWLERSEVRSLLVVSTLLPAPKFLAMVSLIGQRVRGLAGGLVAGIGLVIPTGLMVLLAAVLIQPELLSDALAPLAESIGIAVVGLLLGNALVQWKAGQLGLRNRLMGSALAIAMIAAMALGTPIVPVALGGFIAGSFVIRA